TVLDAPTTRGCGFPAPLGDAMGLYYNKALFQKAGIAAPPKTFSELADLAKRLTEVDGGGAIQVAGFVPLFNFYENYVDRLVSSAGAEWFDKAGKATVSHDPRWAS